MIPYFNILMITARGKYTLMAVLMLFMTSWIATPQAHATCKADAGTLNKGLVCLEGDFATISAEMAGDANIPDGFIRLFVLTSGDDLVIQQLSPLPSFKVEAVGLYTIHTLIYDPETLDLSNLMIGQTTGVDVNGLLIQGGGDICASLDVTGIKFDFSGCTAQVCNAFAGTLKAKDQECLKDGEPVQLMAEEGAAPIVPQGFEVLYVLTSGSDLVLEDAGNMPSFSVDKPGRFTIHTLVYDPATVDLDIIEFGTTTGFDVNSLLIQGGGALCGSLDVKGAPFDVHGCPCEADAGHLTAKSSHDCLEPGASVHIEAAVTGQPTVPAGFQLAYVLTKGDGLVIEDLNDEPEFDVTETGRFTIHTFIYDPSTLDLDIIEFGTTTGFDVNNLLIQGGGDLCGALDVSGAKFIIEECECKADFGKIRPRHISCLEEHGSVVLRADVTKYPTVPSGFKVIYVITSGDELVIRAANNYPAFQVFEPGKYTIHTLVYDPKTLDLDIIKFGKTTGFDVNKLLIQGGGSICAALDVEGAAFHVEACEVCKADFGKLQPKSINCYDGYNWVLLQAKTVEHPTVPSGFKVAYVVTTGSDLEIQAVTSQPAIYVKGTGKVTIHTLVYNPHTLDLGIIKLGKTTGFDVNKLLIQGGGDICAALDVEGAQFHVNACSYHLSYNGQGSTPSHQQASKMNDNGRTSIISTPSTDNGIVIGDAVDTANAAVLPNIFPNPASNFIQIDIPTVLNDQDLTINIMDNSGKVLATQEIAAGTSTARMDVSALDSGTYVVQFNYANGQSKSMLLSKVK